ncbi:MAG: hypothetical protein GY770_33405 [Aestuariibacter sp.]|nr:hypothetical protein [Aestuariibacter sp.]
MRHQLSRYDLKAFQKAVEVSSQLPSLTPAYMAELERRRDQHLAKLAS